MRAAMNVSGLWKVAALAGLAATATAALLPGQTQSQDVTVTGAVVDLSCRFADKPQFGPDHLPCAEMCAKAGVPFGILTEDGKLYLPAVHGENANAGLMAYLEQQVTATGKVWPAGGAYRIQITKLEKKG